MSDRDTQRPCHLNSRVSLGLISHVSRRGQTKPREGKPHPRKVHLSRGIDRCSLKAHETLTSTLCGPYHHCYLKRDETKACVRSHLRLCILLHYTSSLRTIDRHGWNPNPLDRDRLWGRCHIWHVNFPTHDQVLTSDFLLPTRLPRPQKQMVILLLPSRIVCIWN